MFNFNNLSHATLFFAIIFTLASAAATAASAEEKKKTTAAVAAEPEPAEAAYEPEDTLAACGDEKDNDGDGHVDCYDQDCEIYAVCVSPPEKDKKMTGPVTAVPAAETAQTAPVTRVENAPHITTVFIKPERGRYCRDGIDNNHNGEIDCHEESCQGYHYCRRQMYYVPEPEDKAPGFLVSTGIGLALPNFRMPTAEVRSSRYGEDIPFDPDMGGFFQLKLGYLPLKWLGFGTNLALAATGASNRSDFFLDDDDVNYKYDGAKVWLHGGAFVRFQYPFGIFVPYLDLSGGYSYARYGWEVFPDYVDWDDIDDFDRDDRRAYRDTYHSGFGHFTFALEPGFDVFVRKRSIAVGARAWLPVIAAADSSTDNIGILFTLTFTPMWRESARLKPEYEDSAADEVYAVEKETDEADNADEAGEAGNEAEESGEAPQA